jgi:predicted nucleic acid-binding protein
VSYLLDTNVLSETSRPNPAPAVLQWLSGIPDEALFISALTLGEIRRGIERLKAGRQREHLRTWLEHELTEWFGARALPVDTAVADRWGRLLAEAGRTLPSIDSLIAATALHHELRLVTRNERDFTYGGLEVFNPWGS